ncbi:MAG: hypothetical protein AMXMBFR58_31450 [Phycisphaerae bacterium]
MNAATLAATTFAAAIAIAASTSVARTTDVPPLDYSPASISLQPAEPPAPEATTAPAKSLALYGAEGSQWLEVGYGAADNFTDSVDQYLFVTWSTFLAKDIELGLEGGVWYFNQPGDNEAGISGTLQFRWHFYNKDTWSAYLMAGIGVMGATGDVPADGTSFDLMPRAGIGVTKQLTDAGLRLDLGLRWHHISNARINGDDENPSRDGAMLYAGLIFPF